MAQSWRSNVALISVQPMRSASTQVSLWLGRRSTWQSSRRMTWIPGSAATTLAAVSLGLGTVSRRGLRFGVRARLGRRHCASFAEARLSNLGGFRSFSTVSRRAVATDEVPFQVITDEVVAPQSDPRSYRVLRLENGLQVLLASDPTADTSAAALTVRCGTFQDPLDRLGLAHFHEHMLFLGTEKYPKEDEYSRYLSEHGGDSNAFTMSEFTTYYFKVASPCLDGALDRFSQFFVSPTFDPSNVEREMKVVDSESTNYSTEASASEQHPFFRFDVGNLSTLGADDLARTREQLVEWNKSHYQGGAMQLVIVGRESLEELQRSAVEKFSAVRSGAGQEQSYPSRPWGSSQLGRIIRCVPLKEARSISACWPLPPAQTYLFSKPELYLAHLLGHEGPGSLHDILNQLGWVDQLSAGPSQNFADEQLFAVNISLTPEGDQHREEVLAMLFEYVELVRSAGPQEAIFKELAALQEISFAHKEETPLPDDFASGVAMAMQRYPAHEVLRGPFALDEWREDVVAEYLSTLTPERCLIFLTSDAFTEESRAGDAAEKGWKTETWYKASYMEQPFTADQLSQWKASLEKTFGGHPSFLKLPAPNCFIPEDFSLIAPDGGSGAEASKLPMEVTPPDPLVSSPELRLWHKLDKAFQTPREYAIALVHSGAYDAGPEAVVMMRLFCGVVIDDLNTFSYDATVAGLAYSLEFSENLSLSVGGFSDKLQDLLKVLMERLVEVLQSAEAAAAASQAAETEEAAMEALGERGRELLEKLEVQRQILLQDYNNFTREEPWSVGNYYLSQLMLRNSWNLSEYIKVLEQTPDLGVLASTVRKVLGAVQVDVLVHGNVKADAAKAFGSTICDALRELGASAPLPAIRQKQVTKLPSGSTTIFEYDLAAVNPAQENCCTQNIYEVGPTNEDLHRDACVTLACHIAGVSAFQKLRTQQQLGYIAQAFPWVENHVCGLSVLVQGNRMHPKDVDLRIEEWLESFGQDLESMSEEEFQNNVQGVVNERTQRYSRMLQETTRHWSEIMPRRYTFDRPAEAVDALRAVKKEDVIAFFKEYVAAAAPSRRKLSVRILGTSAGDVRSEPDGPDGAVLTSLEELRAFQGTCESYPSPTPADMPPVKAS
eukprot:TRINITY_DN18431_c0_g1_i3.p1 TRINITY_DN18431_c0_g1~~TRINITY_DN18431_c0_g1_i3.p1  ORF type:complete len:1119 (+),score=279.20 TRINITY_DN18431_c0_g1_i3:68-3424(+)